MEIIDPGHNYLLRSFDGGGPVRLTFVKRCDPPEKYPGNHNAHPGTQIQEVLRALIERSEYVNGQIPCPETDLALYHLREVLWLFESRHAQRHDATFPDEWREGIETRAFCETCGHIMCFC